METSPVTTEKTQTTNGKDIAKRKREKYLLKQQKKLEASQKRDAERTWVLQHSSFVTWLEIDQVKRLRQWRDNRCREDTGFLLKYESSSETAKKRKRQYDDISVKDDVSTGYGAANNGHSVDNIHRLNHLIGPFLDLRDKNNSFDDYRDECGRRIFIAEGTTVVQLLIERTKGSINCENSTDDHHHEVISIIVKPQSFFDGNILKTIKESFPSYFQAKMPSEELPPFPFHIFLGAESVLTEIAGFHISRGALGSGFIPNPNHGESWLYTYLETKIKNKSAPNVRILALDQISDTANLGSLIRSSAAFGIDCVVLSCDSCDAWYRKAIRVSMGHCFSVPSVRVKDLASCITTMKDKFGIASYAAVVDSSAEIVLEEVAKGDIEPLWCCVLGNETRGISSKVIDSCKSRIRIGMVDEVDSLGVAVAGAILLHGMKNKKL